MAPGALAEVGARARGRDEYDLTWRKRTLSLGSGAGARGVVVVRGGSGRRGGGDGGLSGGKALEKRINDRFLPDRGSILIPFLAAAPLPAPTATTSSEYNTEQDRRL
jgi:hypothetical protein